MIRIRLTNFLFAFALIVPAAAHAAGSPKPPEQTGAFIKFCAAQTHYDDCRMAMSADEAATQLYAMMNNVHGECRTPEGIEGKKAYEEIMAWLTRHPEYNAKPLHDGMQAAMKGLWNCAKTLNNGMTSRGVPDTAGRYMVYCAIKANYVKCMTEIVTTNVASYAGSIGMNKNATGHCHAPDKIGSHQLGDAVLAWLRAHPQPVGERTTDAIITAIDAIWPCR